MRTARISLVAALALPSGMALAQEVAECDPAPPMTALVEPWEETTALLASGAVRLAVIEATQGSVALVVLTLPPSGEAAPGSGETTVTPAARRCRIVTEGGIGFATLDLAALETAEDSASATFTATLPALRFVPESSELEEVTLRLVFGVADGALAAAIE